MTWDLERTPRSAARRSLDDGLLMSVLCEVIEYWPVAVLLAGRDGGCVPNMNAHRLFGLVMDEGTVLAPNQLVSAFGLHCRDSTRTLKAEEYPSHRALHGEQVLDDFLIYDRHTKEEVTLRCSAQPIRTNHQIVGALITWTEISDLRRSTQRIQKSACDLQQFLAIASHDLQQPVRIMRNYLALLRSHVVPHEDATALKYLNYAEQGASRMHRLLANLLDLTRLERQGERRGLVDARGVAEEVLSQLEDEIRTVHAEVVVQDLPTVMADRAFLVVLLQNLVGNSLKYRHPERPCRVIISACQHPHETVFSVADNGQGIESEYLDEIFKPFQRIHATAGVEGSGLGLDICRRIVSAHGGRIWAVSTPQSGSTFYFTLKGTADHPALERSTGSESCSST